jgi:hypothetical protein
MTPLPPPWTTQTEKGRARIDFEFAHSGKVSLRLEPAPADAYNKIVYAGTGKLFFSFWILTDANDVGDLVWFLFTDTGGKGVQIPVPVDVPFWTKIEREVEIPVGSTGISIVIQRNTKTGTVWVDDVSLRTEAGLQLVQNGSMEEK